MTAGDLSSRGRSGPDTGEKRVEKPAEAPCNVWVVLCAHGEASGRGFREHYDVSRRTLAHAAEVMPLPAPLRVAICAAGALRKALDPTSGSRHNALTHAQALALEAALAGDRDARYRVRVAFGSADPSVEAVLTAAPSDVTVLLQSMIPTDSRLSCGLHCRAAGQSTLAAAPRPLARLWDDPALVAVHRAHLAAQLEEAETSGSTDGRALLIVLHGTLLADKKGQPPAFHTGAQEKQHYGEALRDALTSLPWHPWERVEIAYLNHAVGGEWSQPSLEECLATLAGDGIQEVWAYPAEHLVESAETARLAQTLARNPRQRGHMLPCLNDSPRFIDYLAARVRTAVARGSGTACDRCPLDD